MKKLIAEIKNNGETLIEIEQTLNVNFGALDRGNVSDTTNWGVFSNKGEIAFIDRTNTFKSVIASYPSAEVSIYYVSNVTKKLLATFLIDDYDYNDESKKVTLTLKDKLIDWQQKNIGEYYTFVTKNIGFIASDVFGDDFRSNDGALLRMSEAKVNTSFMKKSSRWSAADKICQATMIRCFGDTDGTPMFSDETPKQTNNIVIRPRNILSIGNNITNNKTKVKNLSISAYNITKHEKENIASDVIFELYDVRGISSDYNYGFSILAEWENYQTNCITQRYSFSGSTTTGVLVSTTFDIPETLFSVDSADITVNFSQLYYPNADSTPRILTTKKTTNPSKASEEQWVGYEIYEPTLIKIENKDNKIYVTFQDDNAVAVNDAEMEQENLVGNYCVRDGTINVLGNFYKDEGEITIGSTSEFSTSLQSNELIQTESTYSIYSVEGDLIDEKNLAQYIVDTATEKYKNGVECVEMEVTPSEYYDEEGINVINSNGDKPLFDKYDIVTPYVIKNGIEQPYSTKADGTAKSFKVIGIEYSYQGLLRQKLYLQETTN